MLRACLLCCKISAFFSKSHWTIAISISLSSKSLKFCDIFWRISEKNFQYISKIAGLWQHAVGGWVVCFRRQTRAAVVRKRSFLGALKAAGQLAQDRAAACARQVEFGETPFSRSGRFRISALFGKRRPGSIDSRLPFPNISTCLASGPFPFSDMHVSM